MRQPRSSYPQAVGLRGRWRICTYIEFRRFIASNSTSSPQISPNIACKGVVNRASIDPGFGPFISEATIENSPYLPNNRFNIDEKTSNFQLGAKAFPPTAQTTAQTPNIRRLALRNAHPPLSNA
jgi:hypothetical protein